MRIVDGSGAELPPQACDPALGRLVPDAVAAGEEPAREARPEEGHLEYRAFYFEDGTSHEVSGPGDPHVGPGGWVDLPGEEPRAVRGADQAWVVDSPAVEARPAEARWEDVLRWVPYTQAELEARAEAQRRERWLSEGQAESDEAMCGLYEMLEAQRAVIEEQDEALCALYEMISGGE